MKKLFLLFAVATLTLAFAGCKGGKTKVVNGSGDTGISEESIEEVDTLTNDRGMDDKNIPIPGFKFSAARIVGMPEEEEATRVVVHMYMSDGTMGALATGAIENGGFSITIPAVLDESILYSFNNMYYGYESGRITISDAETQCFELNLEVTDEEGTTRFGYLSDTFLKFYDERGRIQYFYVDRDVTVTGTVTEVVGFDYEDYDGEYDKILDIEYDMTLKKGWNRIFHDIDIGAKTMKVTSSVFPLDPKLKWVFQGTFG